MTTSTQRINGFLRSEAALLVLLAMALISQTPHTAVLFHRLAPQADGVVYWLGWLHAIAYAIALEFATLVFVVRGQRGLAWGFAFVSVLVNVAYYAVGDWNALYILSAALVSIALPASIAFYSHSVAAEQAHDDARPAARDAPAQRKTAQPAQDAQNDDLPEIDDKTRALQLHSEGLAPAEIARIVERKPTTVASWIRRARNGADAQ